MHVCFTARRCALQQHLAAVHVLRRGAGRGRCLGRVLLDRAVDLAAGRLELQVDVAHVEVREELSGVVPGRRQDVGRVEAALEVGVAVKGRLAAVQQVYKFDNCSQERRGWGGVGWRGAVR